MEVENLNCPNCGGPVQVSNNRTPFNCQHCGSALVVREEAGVSLLELSDKIASIIEGGNQEIISVIQKTSKASTDTKLYQSQIEQELTSLSVQLVPLKAEFDALSTATKDASIVRRKQTISLQIYMLLERTRLLRTKLNEIQDAKNPPLDQLYEQYMYIQSELSYLAYAGNSSDVRQFKTNLAAQHSNVEKQMIEIINTGLESSSLVYPPENDLQVLSDQLKIIQADISTVSALAFTGATQRILMHLRAKEQELNQRIRKVQWETRQADRKKQLETKRAERQRHLEARLLDLNRKKDELLGQRQLTNWERLSFFMGENSLRYLGILINVVVLGIIFAILLLSFLVAVLGVVGLWVFMVLVILVLVSFHGKRIGNFFAGKLRQWQDHRNRNLTLKVSGAAAKLDVEQVEGASSEDLEEKTELFVDMQVDAESLTEGESSPSSAIAEVLPLLSVERTEDTNSAEPDERTESSAEILVDSETVAEAEAEPSFSVVEALPLLDTQQTDDVTSAEPGERIASSDEVAAESESLDGTEAEPAFPASNAEPTKPKFSPKKLALISVTILACGASGFCVLAGTLWVSSQTVFMGVSAILFGLLCLGVSGLAIANLKANKSAPTSSRNKTLQSLYHNQKVIGLAVVGGLVLSCMGIFAAGSSASSSTSALNGTRTPISTSKASDQTDISSLQTAAVETAIMGIFQTATANALTPTSSPVAPNDTPILTVTLTATVTATSTTAPLQGTIIQDVSNMRSAPRLDAPVLTTLAINTNVLAIANSEDKIWLLVSTENGTQGWIHNTLARFSGSLADLPVSTDVLPTPIPTKDAYIDDMSDRFLIYQDAFLAFNEHQMKLQSNLSLLFDEQWRLEMGLYLGVLDVAATNLERIPSVPVNYQQLDRIMKNVAGETHQLVQNYSLGLDNMDAAAIERAGVNLQSMTGYLEAGLSEINRLTLP